MLVEKLKNAIFNLSDFEYVNFIQNSKTIKFIYNDIVVHADDNKAVIAVFYDAEEMGVFTHLKIIDKENSLKTFHNVEDALYYMKYLAKVISDVKYSMYHYFIHRLKQIDFEYNDFSFSIFDSYSDMIEDDKKIRCDFKNIYLKNKKLKYNCLIFFNNDRSCRFSFYSENPIWNEEKICPKRDVDKIIEYILNLETDNYDDIPLIES